MEKRIRGRSLGVVAGILASTLLALGVAMPAFAVSPTNTVSSNNWRVFNYMPATSSWDINQAKADGTGGVQFPFQQFESTTTGSFAVYLLANYNNDLTGKTITATANWTSGTYLTRSTVWPGAYVRVEFQDVASGQYTSNDRWWYTGNTLDLNAATSGTLTAPLTDRANWSNLCGKSATDTATYPGTNCVGGTDPAVSPYDGFTSAMQNVKQVSLAFGSSGSYASGVAVGTAPATFDMTSFTVAP